MAGPDAADATRRIGDYAGHAPLLAAIAANGAARLIGAGAGPPGAGKSAFADALAAALNHGRADEAAVVPMDGFHYDDRLLEARGLRQRKGAPSTFDVGGLRHLLLRLRAGDEPEVAVPVFDRDLEISRGSARMVPAEVRVVIVEGNYLLLDREPWRQLAPCFDITVLLREGRETLERRLTARWRGYGYDEARLREKLEGNDMPNVDLVLTQSRRADFDVSVLA